MYVALLFLQLLPKVFQLKYRPSLTASLLFLGLLVCRCLWQAGDASGDSEIASLGGGTLCPSLLFQPFFTDYFYVLKLSRYWQNNDNFLPDNLFSEASVSHNSILCAMLLNQMAIFNFYVFTWQLGMLNLLKVLMLPIIWKGFLQLCYYFGMQRNMLSLLVIKHQRYPTFSNAEF